MVNFKVSSEEQAIIEKIMVRAAAEFPDIDKLSLMMDITACHANGNPLKLNDLLQADDFNFFHDIFGINRHINRNNGSLMHSFLPRFSKKKE